jgi:hypothetical protein
MGLLLQHQWHCAVGSLRVQLKTWLMELFAAVTIFEPCGTSVCPACHGCDCAAQYCDARRLQGTCATELTHVHLISVAQMIAPGVQAHMRLYLPPLQIVFENRKLTADRVFYVPGVGVSWNKVSLLPCLPAP